MIAACSFIEILNSHALMVKVGITVVSIIEDTAIISAVAAILLAVFTVMQLRHLEKHRNVDISMKLFEWAETDSLRKAFRWMDKKYEFKSYADFKLLEEKDVEASEYPLEVTAFLSKWVFW